ncbi:MAG: protein kinase, partial [Phycisphaerae bacterium]|nr:protein kinase [Phycisphaerae bacterium]
MELPTHHRPGTSSDSDLAAARMIRAAALAARTTRSIDTPLDVISASQLDAPIDEVDIDPWVNDQLSIRGYIPLREIGSGGQGTVYQAIQESTGRNVAIKVISGGPFVSSRRRARLDREANLLASFNHPNIVGIIDRGRAEDGSFFIVMEWIDGVPVDQSWIQLQDPASIARLFIKIALAVNEAHQRGVVHRDLKPSNVRVDRRGEPHILDFGLARLRDIGISDASSASITESGQIVGSIPWLSPEQAARGDEEVDCRSDVYSLGVMLYQAIAGCLPYTLDGSLRENLNRIATAVPRAPSERRAKATRAQWHSLDAITFHALAKNAAERYASAGDFARDLEAYLAGEPLQQTSGRKIRLLPAALITLTMIATGAEAFHLLRSESTSAEVQEIRPRTMIGPAGIRFVRIPIGSYFIGSPAKEIGRRNDETLRKVQVARPFWLSAAPVTQQQFIAVMGFNPSDSRYLGSSLPVQNVSWQDAQNFCDGLHAIKGRKYRLP